MLNNEVTESEQSLAARTASRSVDLPEAASVRLQKLDLARHIATAPNGKSYVVATFDDRRMHQHFTTAIYPQQNGYLTLYRLVLHEFPADTPEDAMRKHAELIRVIQQGRLTEYLASQQ